MKDYFSLQLRLTNRKLQDAGMPPLVGYLLLTIAFIGLSLFLFYKSNYAPYIYPFIALSFITPLSEVRRNEFLKTCFGDKKYRTIRLLENLAVSLPFTLFLLFKVEFIVAGALVLVSLALAISNFNTQLQFTIHTPFGKKPYEFATGFRGTYLALFIAYALAIIAVSVSNFNLGVFALLMVFAVTLSYYAQPEHEYYVWSHSYTPTLFLLNKIKTAILYSTFLAAPLALLLCAFFFNQTYILLVIVSAGYVYLGCIITARYSSFPHEMGLAQGILLALCIVAPPAAILILPYFFNRSVERLQPILK
ncbi:MAG TPA: hypothetical protein VK174_01015 [Chitinophagales bacterium]|nr:hypothetical protein [Chitinophagales bacterium]